MEIVLKIHKWSGICKMLQVYSLYYYLFLMSSASGRSRSPFGDGIQFRRPSGLLSLFLSLLILSLFFCFVCLSTFCGVYTCARCGKCQFLATIVYFLIFHVFYSNIFTVLCGSSSSRAKLTIILIIIRCLPAISIFCKRFYSHVYI